MLFRSYSLENPAAYVHSNVAGHVNILELARHRSIAHLVYASSSSVYGMRASTPFRVADRADTPISLYAATKRADELLSETYAHLFRIPQRSEEHTSELQSLMRISYAVFCLKKKNK